MPDQTLQWYRCHSTDENGKGTKRGEISLHRASAVILSASNTDNTDSGVRFVLSHYKDGSAMPQDVFLSAPSLSDAHLWIAYINKAGKAHEVKSVEGRRGGIPSEGTDGNDNKGDEGKGNDIVDNTAEKEEEKGIEVGGGLGALSAIVVKASEVALKATMLVMWFLLPTYPLLFVADASVQKILFVGLLYGLYTLPTTYQHYIEKREGSKTVQGNRGVGGKESPVTTALLAT